MGTVHVRCGSDIRETLAAAGLAGRFVEYADPVCLGPVPAGLDDPALRRTRAGFLADAIGAGPLDGILARLEAEDAALDALRGGEERVVLWFEHDLHDQAILVRVLDRLGTLDGRLHLICIGEFPGVARFTGLGRLSPGQLAGLWGTEVPVTAPMVAVARAAWAALRAPDPSALMPLIGPGSPALPFLGGALRRHLMEFPCTRDGLGLTQRLALQAVADGAATPAQAFRTLVEATEPQPFLGDILFLAVLRGLAGGERPALTPVGGFDQRIVLTRFGAALLAGAGDWVAANGIDTWHGGVHLQGPVAAWRWDEDAGKVVAAAMPPEEEP